MTIANLSKRLTSIARKALTAAKGKPNRQSPIANRQLLATASIIRPQVRERWLLPQVSAITPEYIETTLRGALAGAHVPQWELFNLMEDTWPRLRKNVLELKMAVRNRRPIFQPYRDEDEPASPTATERMKLVSAALRQMQPDPAVDECAFDDMVADILDAWFKGVSVLEIDWQLVQTRALGRFVAPRCTRWASPVNYAWSGDLQLGLANDTQETLAPFPADRVLVAKCKTKSGSVLGGALLRPLVWWWCAANFSADWLMNFAQIFGVPLRWATYDPTAAQETVDRLCEMMQRMGHAGWGAFPAGTNLQVNAEGLKSGTQTPQGDLLDRADKQCDLLVLGQTLTTDTGGMGRGHGSLALGQVHAQVRGNILDAAARFAAGVIEQQLIPAILRLNYGDAGEAPTLELQAITEEDLQEKAAIIAQLQAAGAGAIIPLDWLGKTFGIPKPESGEATLADAKQGAGAVAPNIPRPTPNLEYPTGGSFAARRGQTSYNNEDRLFAGNPYHDQLGRFTFGPGGSAGPTGPASESANANPERNFLQDYTLGEDVLYKNVPTTWHGKKMYQWVAQNPDDFVGIDRIWLTPAERDHCECALIRLLAGAPAVGVGWVMGPAIDPNHLPERGTLIVKQDPNNGVYTGDLKKNAHTGIFIRYYPRQEFAPGHFGNDQISIIDQMHLASGGQRGPNIISFLSRNNGIPCSRKLHWTPLMTTIPLPPNQRSKPQAKSRAWVGRMALVGLAILLTGFGRAAVEPVDPWAIDAAEQLPRRGYPKNVALEWAVADYNAAHRSNSIAKNYPELDSAEILPAIARAIRETPRKDKQTLARLAALQKSVISGSLPTGSILNFQSHNNNRSPYLFQLGELSGNFSIFLLSGLDENPPEESHYNEKAFIIGVLIRTHKRTDQEWTNLQERIAEKMKRKKEQ